ncbi:MAG: DUF4115 domain-containing protein [Acidobacteriia bacterium]|nr:DUF4115 domain-containing protein [Terriglobia bacterium]
MGSFGERMQREREMRGITLEEIAESTKIGTRSLRALEGEDFDKLPGGIFNKGFVRAYAKYLGIDEEQAVTDFMAAYGEFQQQQPASTTPETPAAEEPLLSLNMLVVGGAIVLLVLIFAAWRFHEPIAGAASRMVHRAKPAPAAQVPSTVAAAPKPAPAAPAAAPLDNISTPGAASNSPAGVPGAARTTASAASQNPMLSGASTVSPAVAALPGEFVLQIRARQDSWVSITADDKVLMQGTLKGEKTIRAKNKVVLTTGNAGAVELSFNGQPQPTLGAGNQVKTVVFTPDGLQR